MVHYIRKGRGLPSVRLLPPVCNLGGALGYPDGKSNGRTAKSNPTLRETTIWLPYFFSENAFFFRFLTLSPAKQPIHTKQKKKPKNAFPPYIRRNRKEKGGKTVSSCSVIDDNGVCGGCVAVYNNSTKKAVPLVLSEK